MTLIETLQLLVSRCKMHVKRTV